MNKRDFGIAVHALAEERPAPTPEFQRACANAYKRGARTNAQLTRALRAPLVEIEDAFVELVRRKVVPSTLAIVVAIAALAGCGTKASEQEVTDNTESERPDGVQRDSNPWRKAHVYGESWRWRAFVGE